MSATLPERLRALHATRVHHFTPVAHGGQPQEPAFAIVATEARLQDLLEAADALGGFVAPDRLTREQVREAALAELSIVHSADYDAYDIGFTAATIRDLCRRLGISL